MARFIQAGSILGGSGRSGLIGSLNEVATAITSKSALEDVLGAVVECAKRVTGTRKAILCVFDEVRGAGDSRVLVTVRGPRADFPEEWWSSEVERLAPVVLAEGRPRVELHREQGAWLLVAPVKMGDEAIGVLAAVDTRNRRFTDEQVAFFAILSTFAASAIENARLAEQSRFMLLASERERIARDMHDGVVQSLFGVSIGLEVCRKQMTRDAYGAARRLEDVQDQLAAALQELRRVVYDLRPVKLRELGLYGGIEYWVEEITSGLDVVGHTELEGEPRPLGADVEMCLYRVAKEAVSNAVRHAGAGRVDVRLFYQDDSVLVEVRDDGNGFAPDEALESANSGQTLGLKSIYDRVGAAGGRVEIVSSPGGGTRLLAVLPV